MANLGSELFDRYYESWWGIEAAYEKIAATHGVTSNILNIITLLYKKRTPMTQNDLSRDLHLSRQTVTSVVDSLEHRGLVTRSIAESDRRSRVVVLTDEGRVFGRKLGRAMRKMELDAFGLFSEEELHALVDGMEKLWRGLSRALGEE